MYCRWCFGVNWIELNWMSASQRSFVWNRWQILSLKDQWICWFARNVIIIRTLLINGDTFKFNDDGLAGHSDDTYLGAMGNPHVFFSFSPLFFYLGCGELPNSSDDAGVGDELHPSSLVRGPRKSDEELEMLFLKTLAIRWVYASCTLIALINHQAYDNMYVCVADTSNLRTLAVRYICAINALLIR